ncbi:SPla/RYanodine receptor (SPRY) domain-containing protein [Galdieria sulphuraria]|uniref:SPla/RYanodine receptor (SPRY) domain-containing protein n=1 Tax=Galdieria sulphuraria TaxID=130081 RepID=M2VV51_GALSU|nr:SPla/RYanodine receptor (SPRY) domain-containing protein [Galdieria sulphuraria]EME27091.1 SPla/RYanodine receptor (SPRY) domain-containing protein [Galdieria sulphuraria]|eukprot:XP_005703611.1 SPla/RYanodine receptor (SPRY) domain-containing protein [Galdieria sulphuraria]
MSLSRKVENSQDTYWESSLNRIPFATHIWSECHRNGLESKCLDSTKVDSLWERNSTVCSYSCENGNKTNRNNKTQRKRAPWRPNWPITSVVLNNYETPSLPVVHFFIEDNDTKSKVMERNNTTSQWHSEEPFCGSYPSGLLGDIALERQDWKWDDNNQQDHELPTGLNLRQISRFLEVSMDRLTVRYVGSACYEHEVGTIQADKPIPTGTVDIFYFEVEILSCDSENVSIAVGLSRRVQDFCKSIGEEPGSFAYRGKDGKIKTHGSVAMNYATPYQQGDVIGCGYLFETRQIFFTKNGVMLGMAFSQVESHLYASVSLHRPNEKVSFRFGSLDDVKSTFVFSNVSWRNEWKESKRKQIQDIELSPCISLKYVAEYLLRCGYQQTFLAFKSNTDGILSYNALEDSVELRGKVREYIMQGQIEQAVSFVEEHKPSLLQVGSWSCFALTCQRWIEWLRDSNKSSCLSEMVQVSISYLSPLIPWMNEEQERFFYPLV